MCTFTIFSLLVAGQMKKVFQSFCGLVQQDILERVGGRMGNGLACIVADGFLENKFFRFLCKCKPPISENYSPFLVPRERGK